jgi:hypothetical protein
MSETPPACRLTAWRLPGRPTMKMIPAPAERAWMETAQDRWPNRCLPLRMANESGWFILNDAGFEVTWNERPDAGGLEIEPLGGTPSRFAVSMFGYGILTFDIPFLFRTSPGYNLLARGPSNEFKDGVQPLEGLVETDWAEATFTMNWKITRPFVKVRFDEGDPICMIVPHRRGELEAIAPEIRPIASAPSLLYGYNSWRESREESVERKKHAEGPDLLDWEGHYMRGTHVSGAPAPEHQVRRRLLPFVES